jgi:hypothetical protein
MAKCCGVPSEATVIFGCAVGKKRLRKTALHNQAHYGENKSAKVKHILNHVNTAHNITHCLVIIAYLPNANSFYLDKFSLHARQCDGSSG